MTRTVSGAFETFWELTAFFSRYLQIDLFDSLSLSSSKINDSTPTVYTMFDIYINKSFIFVSWLMYGDVRYLIDQVEENFRRIQH